MALGSGSPELASGRGDGGVKEMIEVDDRWLMVEKGIGKEAPADGGGGGAPELAGGGRRRQR
jgi:hypothetical protein